MAVEHSSGIHAASVSQIISEFNQRNMVHTIDQRETLTVCVLAHGDMEVHTSLLTLCFTTKKRDPL